jgi:hypothetical protein
MVGEQDRVVVGVRDKFGRQERRLLPPRGDERLGQHARRLPEHAQRRIQHQGWQGQPPQVRAERRGVDDQVAPIGPDGIRVSPRT